MARKKIGISKFESEIVLPKPPAGKAPKKINPKGDPRPKAKSKAKRKIKKKTKKRGK